jgi:hypothetical protein
MKFDSSLFDGIVDTRHMRVSDVTNTADGISKKFETFKTLIAEKDPKSVIYMREILSSLNMYSHFNDADIIAFKRDKVGFHLGLKVFEHSTGEGVDRESLSGVFSLTHAGGIPATDLSGNKVITETQSYITPKNITLYNESAFITKIPAKGAESFTKFSIIDSSIIKDKSLHKIEISSGLSYEYDKVKVANELIGLQRIKYAKSILKENSAEILFQNKKESVAVTLKFNEPEEVERSRTLIVDLIGDENYSKILKPAVDLLHLNIATNDKLKILTIGETIIMDADLDHLVSFGEESINKGTGNYEYAVDLISKVFL